ncbi:MAG: carbonic anhydrase [Gemmataceae bacterium]
MKKLIDGLRHFQDHVLWERKELFERSVQGQKPQALLITCSDSRVLPETLMLADPGDLFVSRNAGNLVPPPAPPAARRHHGRVRRQPPRRHRRHRLRALPAAATVKALLEAGEAADDAP